MRRVEHKNFTIFLAFALLLVIVSVLMPVAHANVSRIECETFYGEKRITIEGNNLTYEKKIGSRSISSTNDAKVQKKFDGIKQQVYINGEKHVVHIENVKKFDETNDYLAITSKEGHKMTYPISCTTI